MKQADMDNRLISIDNEKMLLSYAGGAAVLKQLIAGVVELEQGIVPATPVINVHGPAGIGKSYLSQHLFDTFHIATQTPVILLQFGSHQSDHVPDTTWEVVHTTLSRYFPMLSSLVGTVNQQDTPPVATERLRFFSVHLEQAQAGPCLLILDGLDQIGYWRWLQVELIRPLLETQRTLMVCTSRAPLFWHFWELREQSNSYELPLLTFGETAALVQREHSSLPAELVYSITHGYPGGIAELDRVLVATQHEVAQLGPATWGSLTDQLSPAVSEAVRYVGMMRRANATLIQLVLGWIPQACSAPVSYPQVLDLMRELTEHGFFTQNPGGALRFAADKRATVSHNLKTTNPTEYFRICKLLAQSYYHKFLQDPILDAESFNDWLYFSLLSTQSASATPDWEQELYRALSRAKTNVNVLELLAEDAELLVLLRGTSQWTMLYSHLLEFTGQPTRDAIAFLALTREQLATYQRALLDRCISRLPQQSAAVAEALLDEASQFDGLFMATELTKRLHERLPNQQLSATSVRHILTLLCSQGLCWYDQTEGGYLIHPLTDLLSACFMPKTPACEVLIYTDASSNTPHYELLRYFETQSDGYLWEDVEQDDHWLFDDKIIYADSEPEDLEDYGIRIGR